MLRSSIACWIACGGRVVCPAVATFPPGAPSGATGSSRPRPPRSEEHTSELQSLMRNPYAVFGLQKKIIHAKCEDKLATIVHAEADRMCRRQALCDLHYR